MVLVSPPPDGEGAVGHDVEPGHHGVPAVVAHHHRTVGVDDRRIGDQAAGEPAHLHQGAGAFGEVGPHQVQRCLRDAVAEERPVVALAALPVVEEPCRPEGDDAVPAVGLARKGAVSHRCPLVGVEASVPAHPQQAGIPDHEDLVPVGGQPGHRRFGQGAPVDDPETVGLEDHQLARRPAPRPAPGPPDGTRRSPWWPGDRRAGSRTRCRAGRRGRVALAATERSGWRRWAWLPKTT